MALPLDLPTIQFVANILGLLGVLGYARKLAKNAHRNSRLLLGEPDVESDGGIMGMVYRHEEELDEIWDRFGPSENHDLRADGSHPPLPREIQELTESTPTTMNPIDWIRKRVNEAGAYRESDTERDGFLSYSAEAHAVGHGLYDGLTDWRPKPGPLPDNDDVRAEPHYYKGAYVLGTILHVGLLAALAFLAV